MANYNSGVFNSISTFLGLGKQGFFHRCETGIVVYCDDGYMETGHWIMYILAGLKVWIQLFMNRKVKLDGAGYFYNFVPYYVAID